MAKAVAASLKKPDLSIKQLHLSIVNTIRKLREEQQCPGGGD